MRPPSIHHVTSIPYQFFGRRRELEALDLALDNDSPSVIAMVGPGGQGKTAIVQHWLETLAARRDSLEGLFLWSFYRGKDSDLCLRTLFAYAEGRDDLPEVSASFCVDRLLPLLRSERWAIVLDGAEVVQHEQGAWFGRFVHPELGRLLEELASAPMSGAVVLTSRFPLPTLESRFHAQVWSLSTLDLESGVRLLASLGVRGTDQELEAAANAAGLHAKAVELLGTWLAHFHGGVAARIDRLPTVAEDPTASAEEWHVLRVLLAFQETLSRESQDVLALATAFRQPVTETRLLQYLVSEPLQQLLHATWGRDYEPFPRRSADWIADQVQQLVDLRLLERVGLALTSGDQTVLDTHPLVRSGFEDVLGPAGHEENARARAGFLRGRPDRRPPLSLEEAREEVELFHAYCDAGHWNEADGTFVALDNPKHRFLAPAFERDLLLRFFPDRDWRQPPLWPGFGRHRSLAICFELLGEFDDAIAAYRPSESALAGDALIALGRLQPFLDRPHVQHPWQQLWQAYRAHALCLRGETAAGLALANTLIPLDVYEWVHVFESWLRTDTLSDPDFASLFSSNAADHTWSRLARERMRLDYERRVKKAKDLAGSFRSLLEAYDRGGLPFERALTRLSFARYLETSSSAEAETLARGALDLATRHGMAIVEIDAREMLGDRNTALLRDRVGYRAATRK